MPIILDQFEEGKRSILFNLNTVGSQALTVTASEGFNFLVSASEPFSLQRPYKILETRFEKKVNSLLLSDGVNSISFSSSLHEETDEIRILPDFGNPIKNKVWNRFKKVKIEPSELIVATRFRSERLSALGIGANPTFSWDIDFQVHFIFENF